MGSPGGTPPRPDGPWHEAVPYTSPTDLAEQLTPRVHAAVAAGDPVLAVLAPDTGERLRAALGGDPGGVDFQDPHDVHRLPGFTVALRWARTSRLITATGGRALVVGQQLEGLPGCDAQHWARLDIGLDVATAGLPITVLCAYAAGSPVEQRVRSTHPVLAGPNGPEPSPTYRVPQDAVIDYPPPPPPDLGPPAVELEFDARRLAELRHVTAGVADAGGLEPERVADVVLAVNELASNSVEHGPGSGTLRLWTDGGVVAEVADNGRMAVPFPGMAMPPPRGARGRGLWLVSELSDVLQVWSDDGGTVIRMRAGG